MSRGITSGAVPADLLPYIENDEEACELVELVDWTRLPRHVAIIMDGNGRWAGLQGLPRVEGHRAGITAVREVVETAARSGVETLTLYAFSVENWKRPQLEIDALMELLKEYLSRELGTLLEHSIRFESIGRLDGLPADVQEDVRSAIAATSTNDGMRFIIALNYGGRTELVDAFRAALEDTRDGNLDPADLDESWIADHLYTAGVADPDLLIRTSGELRISNFMLYQIAYAEIWVTSKLWPDFRRADLLRAIVDFQKRERRYGSVGTGIG
jgi:undecaprenyl diphosphate synthase